MSTNRAKPPTRKRREASANGRAKPEATSTPTPKQLPHGHFAADIHQANRIVARLRLYDVAAMRYRLARMVAAAVDDHPLGGGRAERYAATYLWENHLLGGVADEFHAAARELADSFAPFRACLMAGRLLVNAAEIVDPNHHTLQGRLMDVAPGDVLVVGGIHENMRPVASLDLREPMPAELLWLVRQAAGIPEAAWAVEDSSAAE